MISEPKTDWPNNSTRKVRMKMPELEAVKANPEAYVEIVAYSNTINKGIQREDR